MSNLPYAPRVITSPSATCAPPNLVLTNEDDRLSVPLSPLAANNSTRYVPEEVPRPYSARSPPLPPSPLPLSPLAKTSRRYQSIASPPSTKLRHLERRSTVSLETRFAQLDYGVSPKSETGPTTVGGVRGFSLGHSSGTNSSPVHRHRRQNRRAVIIGVTYSGTKGVNELPSSANHMAAFYDLLTMKLGFHKESIWLLTDHTNSVAGAIRLTPTRANIINAIKWLVLNAKRGEKLIFAFCGHGAQVRKDDPKSPRRVLQCIVPSDYPVASPITGTNLFTLLASSLNIGAHMTMIFDCGYSNRIMRLPYLHSVKRGHKGKLVVCEDMDDNEHASVYNRSSPFGAIMKHSRQQKEYVELKKQLMEERRDALAASLFDKGTVICLTNAPETTNRLLSFSSSAPDYGSLSSAFVSVMHDVYSENSRITLAELLTDISTLLVKKRDAVLPQLRLSHKLDVQSQVVNL